MLQGKKKKMMCAHTYMQDMIGAREREWASSEVTISQRVYGMKEESATYLVRVLYLCN